MFISVHRGSTHWRNSIELLSDVYRKAVLIPPVKYLLRNARLLYDKIFMVGHFKNLQ